MDGLTRYDRMRAALIEAHSIDDVKEIRDKAEALRQYAKQAGESLENQNMIAEIKLRAERRAGELIKEMPKATGAMGNPNGQGAPIVRSHDETAQPPTLNDLGITKSQSSRWQSIASIPEEVFEAEIIEVKAKNMELTSAGMLRVAKEMKQEAARQQRAERIEQIAAANKPLEAPRTYPVIYADPPWRYEYSKTDNRKIENHYPTMDLAEICALPVSEIAAPDAVLFLWTTSPKLAESMQVIEAWGFVYRTCMVWDKERIGMGYYARQQHELLLIATRGSLPVPEPANRPASVVRIRRDPEHSAKPHEFYDLIERMYPEYGRIELFARNARPGWDAWGNQI